MFLMQSVLALIALRSETTSGQQLLRRRNILQPGRQLFPASDLELLVDAAQLALDSLRGDEEGLSDLPVAHATGGLTPDSSLARRQSVDAENCAPPWFESEGVQLILGVLGEAVGPATMREVQAGAQRSLRGCAVATPPECRTELDQGARLLKRRIRPLDYRRSFLE
jgi:hypothetical protein